MSHREPLGRHRLVVIGAGPVGIAALWFAQRHGIDAVAIDAHPRPLSCIRSFTSQLVTVSSAFEWEIDGLPVDCCNPREVTREDLLRYYARVVAHGRLHIAGAQRVIGIAPAAGAVRVEVQTTDGPAHWLAEQVLVTPWYRRRPLALAGMPVRDELGDGPPSRDEKVVVVGGGLSGLELADSLIRAGCCVTLLARGPLRLPAALQTLFDASGSRCIDHIVGLTGLPKSRGLRVERDGELLELPCTVAFNCTGHEANGDLLQILHDAGALSDQERRALTSFRQSTGFERRDASAAADLLPNLSDALWTGRGGVRFAGSVFHVGGIFGAGIVFSIETARWAVEAMAGVVRADHPPPDAHLPAWLLQQAGRADFPARGPCWSEPLAAVVPVPIPAWSRGTRVIQMESATGQLDLSAPRKSFALGPASQPPLSDLQSACHDGFSVGELSEALPLDREALLWALYQLWHNNGLTWVAPPKAP